MKRIILIIIVCVLAFAGVLAEESIREPNEELAFGDYVGLWECIGTSRSGKRAHIKILVRNTGETTIFLDDFQFAGLAVFDKESRKITIEVQMMKRAMEWIIRKNSGEQRLYEPEPSMYPNGCEKLNR